jgi:hypothetical protein
MDQAGQVYAATVVRQASPTAQAMALRCVFHLAPKRPDRYTPNAAPRRKNLPIWLISPCGITFVDSQRRRPLSARDLSRPYLFGHIAPVFGRSRARRCCAGKGPRDVCDGRWSEWSTGTRMVAVDVAIAHRGPRGVAEWSMVANCRGGRNTHTGTAYWRAAT